MKVLVLSWWLAAGLAPLQIPAASSGPEPPEGHVRAVLYHFTESERDYFLGRHASWDSVRDYLRDPERTPWGILVEDYGREFLLFRDVRERIHVVEVTGAPIADALRKAPFESPRFEVIGLGPVTGS